MINSQPQTYSSFTELERNQSASPNTAISDSTAQNPCTFCHLPCSDQFDGEKPQEPEFGHVEGIDILPGWAGNKESTAALARQAREGVQRGIALGGGDVTDSDDAILPPRILVVGAAGWGKSTLVNNMFGDILSKTAAGGIPVTKTFREFGPCPNAPVCLVDTPGLERCKGGAQNEAVIRFVRTRARMPLTERVHAVWFIAAERWQPADAQLLQALRSIVPVIVVITKCDLPERSDVDERTGLPAKISLRDEIIKQFDDVDVVFCADPRKRTTDWEPSTCSRSHSKDFFAIDNRKRSWACEFDIGDGTLCGLRGVAEDNLCGYTNLSQVTVWKLPLEFMPAFVRAQRTNCALKDMRAVAIIRAGALAMTGIAATPLPLPDLPLLLAAEGYMATRLFLLYNVPADFANVALFSSINATVIGSLGIGAKIIAKLLKITGAGLPIGVAIDVIVSATAGVIIGIAIAKVCSNWMVATAERDRDDFHSFQTMMLDTVAGLDITTLATATIRLVVFKDDRALTDLIKCDSGRRK